MKLKYQGQKLYIVLPDIATTTQSPRIDSGDIFECTPEVAAKLLKWNSQYNKPIFTEPAEDDLGFLKDVEVTKNKMAKPAAKNK